MYSDRDSSCSGFRSHESSWPNQQFSHKQNVLQQSSGIIVNVKLLRLGHITRRDSSRLNTTVPLSWVASSDVSKPLDSLRLVHKPTAVVSQTRNHLQSQTRKHAVHWGLHHGCLDIVSIRFDDVTGWGLMLITWLCDVIVVGTLRMTLIESPLNCC